MAWPNLSLPAFSSSPAETEALGRALAQDWPYGGILALVGTLGAGKTHLVRGIAAGLGLDPDQVSSPTFTLFQEYGHGPALVHMDCYRLSGPEAFERAGGAEYLESGVPCVVEWPERILALLPAETVFLAIEVVSATERAFKVVSRPVG